MIKLSTIFILIFSVPVLAFASTKSIIETKHCNDTRCLITTSNLKLEDTSTPIELGLEGIGLMKNCTRKYQGRINSWYGSCAGGGELNLIKYKNVYYGSINADGKSCELKPSEGSKHALICRSEIDSPDEYVSLYAGFQTERILTENLVDEKYKLPATMKENSSNLAAPTTLNIMVLWSRNAELAECMEWKAVMSTTDCSSSSESKTIMEAKVALAFDQTNTAFANSDIDTRLCLVYAYRDESFEEKNTTDVTSLEDDAISLMTTNDAILDDVHDLRIAHGADIVAMIVENSATCGGGFPDPEPKAMFSMTSRSCTTNLLHFGITLGKNLVSVLCFYLQGSLLLKLSLFMNRDVQLIEIKWTTVTLITTLEPIMDGEI